MKCLTHSQLSTLQSCPRRYYYQYVLGIRKHREGEAPLQIGKLFHELLEHGKLPDCDDEFFAATAQALYNGYQEYWKDSNIEVIQREAEFDIPLVNPKTNKPSRNFTVAGKIDCIGKWRGNTVLVETKTTGENLDPASDYWRKLRMDQQISIYRLGCPKAVTTIYDVVRRPTMNPHAKVMHCTVCGQRRLKKTKECGCGDISKERNEAPETPAEYFQRITDDIKLRPEYYYARQEIPRLRADLDQFKKDLWAKQQMLTMRIKVGCWDRNTGACNSRWRCQYLDFCQSGFDDDILPEGFYRNTGNEELSF